jgi:hypothetical protein
MKQVSVELFHQAGICSCGQGFFRDQVERIKTEVEARYSGVEVDVVYMPVGIKRAWDLGVTMSDSAVVNERLVLEGGYSADKLRAEIEKAAREAHDG